MGQSRTIATFLVKLDLGFPSGQSLLDAFDNFLGASDLPPGALYFAGSAANGAALLTESPPSLATNDASYAARGTTSFSRGATSGSSGPALNPSCLPLFTGHVSLLGIAVSISQLDCRPYASAKDSWPGRGHHRCGRIISQRRTWLSMNFAKRQWSNWTSGGWYPFDTLNTTDISRREFFNRSIASDVVVPPRAPFRNTGSRCSLATVSQP